MTEYTTLKLKPTTFHSDEARKHVAGFELYNDNAGKSLGQAETREQLLVATVEELHEQAAHTLGKAKILELLFSNNMVTEARSDGYNQIGSDELRPFVRELLSLIWDLEICLYDLPKMIKRGDFDSSPKNGQAATLAESETKAARIQAIREGLSPEDDELLLRLARRLVAKKNVAGGE